jgi:mono/diheme cytochrome c family protein
MSYQRRITTIAVPSLALLLVFLSACYPNPQPVGLTPVPTLAPAGQVVLVAALQRPVEGATVPVPSEGGQAEAALGAPIYFLHCSSCHGVQGQGIDAPPLRDSQYVGTKSKQEVFSTIADGRTGTEMPAWLVTNGGSLTDVEISRVIAYLGTWQGVPPLPTSTPVPEEPTETPLPPDAPTPEPAQPSLPGGPGPAASLAGEVDRGQSGFGLFCAVCHSAEGVGGVPNPGSDDGTVPELNPIDPTIENPDPKVFAANVDLFIEHGSVPDGPSPMIMMPSFGDAKMLTDQEIADLIAYVISLNATEAAP